MSLKLVDRSEKKNNYEPDEEETLFVMVCVKNSLQNFYLLRKDISLIKEMYINKTDIVQEIVYWQMMVIEDEETIVQGSIFLRGSDIVWFRVEKDPESPIVDKNKIKKEDI